MTMTFRPWTDDEIAIGRHMIADGKSRRDIAAALNRTLDSVNYKFGHVEKRSYHHGPWADEKVRERLITLHADGVAFSRIADELGVSRSGCIAKCRRLGLPMRIGDPVWRVARQKKEPKPRRVRTIKQPNIVHYLGAPRLVKTMDIMEEINPVADFSADNVPIAQRKQLLDLQPHDCRWPYGDPGKPDFFFCGATSESGRPYCSYHDHVARYGSENISEEE